MTKWLKILEAAIVAEQYASAIKSTTSLAKNPQSLTGQVKVTDTQLTNFVPKEAVAAIAEAIKRCQNERESIATATPGKFKV